MEDNGQSHQPMAETHQPLVAPWRFNRTRPVDKNKKGNRIFIRMKNRQVRGAQRMNG